MAHFSYPFEFEMFYKDESYVAENKGNLIKACNWDFQNIYMYLLKLHLQA